MNQRNFLAAGLLTVFLSAIFWSAASTAADIERPRIQLVDKMGVNLQNGQVTHSLSTVGIGGAMGLSHSISVYANEMNYPGMRGFSDKYYAVARNVQLCTSPSSCNPMNIMRVHDWSDTADFAYYVGGVLQQSGSATSGYTYVPTSDERQILEVSGSEFLWTKPDGTVVHFNRSGTGLAASAGGILTSVEYPNGFTIWVAQGSVNTNTGFQLKYYFTATNPPLDKTDPPGLQAPAVSPSWPLSNPQYVRGINAYKVYCDRTTSPCSAATAAEWPTATFAWPAGMPRTMYIGDSIVTVTDSAQRVTTYKYHAYDLAYDQFGNVVPPYVANTQFSPRLKEITPPGASAVTLTYDYNNLFAAYMYYLENRLQTAGVVKSAIRLGIGQSYTINSQGVGGDTQNSGGANGGITLVDEQNYFGNPTALYYADTSDGRMWFEETARNFPRQFDKTAAPVERYYYGTRSNITQITYNGGPPTGFDVLAEYPATCTVSTRRTCNLPTRTRDANGNWTDFAYDDQSGQVLKVTYPANKDGIRPETRYTYQLMYATYLTAPGVETQAPTGVWMKKTEKYCINSAASGGTCAGSDEVTTTYEYNHPNLLRTGMLVAAPGALTRRTCHQYDKYGNQIGVTTPNANLGACPAGTP